MLTSSKNVANVLPIAVLLLAGTAIGLPKHARANDPACTVSGSSLSAAKQQFEQSCPGRIRLDCDPLGGNWQCSTQSLPLKSGQNSPTVAPSNPAPISSTQIDSSALLLIQAENASQTTGSGWSTERSLRGFSQKMGEFECNYGGPYYMQANF